MTTPTPTTPEEENLPQAPATKMSSEGFFNRVRRELKPEEEPIHPTEAAEIVIMEEPTATNERT
jgi:hypothetical protein